LDIEKWEAFLMRTDLRVKHDVETRRRASELFERGYGRILNLNLPRIR